MLSHGSMLCPAEIATVVSLLASMPAIWTWLRWRIGRG
jgi:hypothetical protein